jgi:hypothetical protein
LDLKKIKNKFGKAKISYAKFRKMKVQLVECFENTTLGCTKKSTIKLVDDLS